MSAPERAAQAAPFADAVRGEVLDGLRGTVKSLPAKLFYDERGSALFERICEQPEYYLTRAELGILERCAGEIAELAGRGCALVEYGSGAGVKVRLLLDALPGPTLYAPVDLSREQLARVSRQLAREYSRVAVHPVCADYSRAFELPAAPPGTRRRLGFFPGSSIGNFHPTEATAFLSRARHVLGQGAAFVLGVDRVKPAAELNAAYNDANGVTAEFNLNVLRRLNHEFGADFDLAAFRHRAFFDPLAGRVEMHLESLREQVVCIADERIPFAPGETIWTESSYKYDLDTLGAIVTSAGFRIERVWTDRGDRFWLAFLTVAMEEGR